MNTNENRSINLGTDSSSDEDENSKLIMSAPVLSTESRRRLAAGGKHLFYFKVYWNLYVLFHFF